MEAPKSTPSNTRKLDLETTAEAIPAQVSASTVEPGTKTPAELAATESTPRTTVEPPVEPAPVAAVEQTPIAAVEPTPVAAVEPTPIAAVEPTPIAAVEPTPIAAVEPTPVAAVEPTIATGAEHSEKKGAEVQSNLRSSIVSLATMRDHWRMMSGAMDEKMSGDEEGPVHALHATQALLKNVYYLDQFLPDDLKPRWRSIRGNVQIGFIKDTKKHGNTSVSMGVAKTLDIDCVCLLNCGTGGVKYQMYLKANGILYLSSEYKPKNGASPNALALGGYKPKVSATFEATAAQLAEELSSAELPWAGKVGCPVYAFVTGSIRQAWEEADESGKQNFEQAMEQLFGPHNIQKLAAGSFFMTQVGEGEYELRGADRKSVV